MSHHEEIKRCAVCLHARGCHEPPLPATPYRCDAAPRVRVCAQFSPPVMDKYDHSHHAFRTADRIVQDFRRTWNGTGTQSTGNQLFEALAREIAHAIERAAQGQL